MRPIAVDCAASHFIGDIARFIALSLCLHLSVCLFTSEPSDICSHQTLRSRLRYSVIRGSFFAMEMLFV